MSKTVLVRLVETHVTEEEFSIDKLPKDWEDMTSDDQWGHVVRHGKYEQSNTLETNVEGIQEIEVEEESA